jgi:hypothetical protein
MQNVIENRTWRVFKYGMLVIPFISYGLAFVIEPFFRTLVQKLYILLSRGNIVFVGKNFHLFPSVLLLISFVLGLIVFYGLLVFRRRRVGIGQVIVSVHS